MTQIKRESMDIEKAEAWHKPEPPQGFKVCEDCGEFYKPLPHGDSGACADCCANAEW